MTTLNASQRSGFDCALRAAKRRQIDTRILESGRTLVAEFSDATFLQPFVGTHRVQRIPKRASRRHTSTCTVAILEEIESDFSLDENDLAERFTRGYGPGGQHKNKTDSCVILTHIPSGLEVRCDSRSQWENRQQARRELSKRLSALLEEQAGAESNERRKSQISSGKRPAKGFTWNEQHDSVVDHASGQKWKMTAFVKGRF